MRKLVTIQKIKSLKPILAADRIEQAEVMGWTTVVKKGEFKVGDPCIFFEVDSILPDVPWAEFMRPRKFRVKTSKLKGVLSQGLALPLSVLTPEQKAMVHDKDGFEVTELLGVKKYEPPIPDVFKGTMEHEGPFVSHVPKTDEERVQSCLEYYEALKGMPYVMTVKVDGASMTVTYDRDDVFKVCGRNYVLKRVVDRPDKYWQVALKYQINEILRGTGLAIQGELCGPGIQKNRLYLNEPEILIFNIFDWKNRRHFGFREITDFCTANKLKTVPLEEEGDSFSYLLEELLEKAKGVYAGTTNRREGIVVRTHDSKKISFKVLNNDFLLMDEE